MKKQLLPAIILAAAFFTVKAQKPDSAQLVLHYKFSHIRDTTHPANPYTENMVLIVGKSAGVYKSYDGLLQEAAFQKQFAGQQANSPDGNVKTDRHFMASGTEYYQFPNEKKLFTKERMGPVSNYLMQGVLPIIDWKITGDTASFGGLLCQQATAHFKGRFYTAWFCPGLPIHTGPWKLNGLPGLIVEAYDAKKEVVFKFDGIEKPAAGEGMDVIKLPADAIKTTEADFARLKELSRKDPAAFSRMLTINAGGVPGVSGPQIDSKPMAGPVINNPVELPGRQ